MIILTSLCNILLIESFLPNNVAPDIIKKKVTDALHKIEITKYIKNLALPISCKVKRRNRMIKYYTKTSNNSQNINIYFSALICSKRFYIMYISCQVISSALTLIYLMSFDS